MKRITFPVFKLKRLLSRMSKLLTSAALLLVEAQLRSSEVQATSFLIARGVTMPARYERKCQVELVGRRNQILGWCV